MGLWALWTFLGGLLLLAGMQGWGLEQGEGWGWLSPEGVCGVCGLTGTRIQSLVASLGPGSSRWDMEVRLASAVCGGSG